MLEKNRDYVARLVRQKRWRDAGPMLFDMLPHREFSYGVFYGSDAILALLRTGHTVDDIRSRAAIALEEMVLSDDFVYYLLCPLREAGIVNVGEYLEWYRRTVSSHEASNKNRGCYVSELIKNGQTDEVLRQIRRGCSVDAGFFKYSGEEYYEFMREQGHGAEAESLMAAAEGR